MQLALIENTIAAPVFRAITQTAAGQAALREVILQPAHDPAVDYRARTRELATQHAPCLAVLIAAGDAHFRTAHTAFAPLPTSAPIYLARGIDFGLAQAHDFVATAALEVLRRWLEA